MSGAFSLVNVLAASLGPGTLGFNGEPHNFFIVSSIMTLCMILLNTAWGVIFFSSLETSKSGLVLKILVQLSFQELTGRLPTLL